jgi:four helix bundle protein
MLYPVPGDFVDLLVWQKASALVAALSSELRQLKGPGVHSARDQMIRAAESIPANIAEGYGRGITGDCARFLTVARASAAELESHLRIAVATHRLPMGNALPLIAQTREVRYLVHRLLISVRLRIVR